MRTAAILRAAALGAGLAVLLGAGMRSLLFEGTATDPVIFGVAAALLVGVSLAAMLLPAVRAARTDPLEALRSQ